MYHGPVWNSKSNLHKSGLSFYHMGPRDPAEVLSPGSRQHLYCPSVSAPVGAAVITWLVLITKCYDLYISFLPDIKESRAKTQTNFAIFIKILG